MEFEGPTTRDFSNVVSLNLALLELAADDASAIPMPGWLSGRFGGLDSPGRERLAKTPVLLLSVQEADNGRWAPVFESRTNRDLLSTLDAPTPRLAELTAATLAFLWQLAARDAYAARVVSAAPIEWCENLADAALVDVLDFGRRGPRLATIRHAESIPFWERLLSAGTSDEPGVRRAARLAAMQAMLTGSAQDGHHRPLRNAACSMRPAARVAERDGH